MYALSSNGATVQSVDDLGANPIRDTGDKIHVITVRDGLQAVEFMRTNPVDLVVTDVDMPGLDGWQVAEAAQKTFPQVPVVIVSSLVQTGGHPARPLDAGRTYLVAKSERDVAVDTVLRLVNKRIERPLRHAIRD